MGWVRFAVLGLGAGACYGLAAQGIVLVYRGSGVLNFANGAIGMVGAFFFYNARESGTPTWLAFALALAPRRCDRRRDPPRRSCGRSAARRRSSRLIATLGLFTAFYAFAVNRYGVNIRIITKLIEPTAVEVLPDISIGHDRIVLLVIGVGADDRAHPRVPPHPVRPRDDRGGREPAGDRRPGHLARPRRRDQLGDRHDARRVWPRS